MVLVTLIWFKERTCRSLIGHVNLECKTYQVWFEKVRVILMIIKVKVYLGHVTCCIKIELTSSVEDDDRAG